MIRRPVIRWICALVVPLGLTVAALASAKLTVTATIYNSDASSNAFTLQSDGSASAVYSSGSGANSEITPNVGGTLYYQWGLDLTNSSRSFYLTLVPVNNSAPGPFSGPLPFNGQLYSRCFTSNGGYQNWTQIQTQFPDSNCAMRANFTYSGASYSLVMSPAETGTGTATVTCTNWNSSSKSCSAWTDAPTVGIANANVADLYSGANLVGQYFLSFNITLTYP